MAIFVHVSSSFLNSEYDVIIGGLTQNQIKSDQFDPSAVYLEDEVTVCVKKAAYYPQWMNIFLIVVDAQTWWMGSAVGFSGIAAIFLSDAVESAKIDIWASFILAFRVLVGAAPSYQLRGSMFRLVYFSILISQVLAVTIWSAYYISFVARRIPKPQISSIDEVDNLNYQILGSDAATSFLNEYYVVSWPFQANEKLYIDCE